MSSLEVAHSYIHPCVAYIWLFWIGVGGEQGVQCILQIGMCRLLKLTITELAQPYCRFPFNHHKAATTTVSFVIPPTLALRHYVGPLRAVSAFDIVIK